MQNSCSGPGNVQGPAAGAPLTPAYSRRSVVALDAEDGLFLALLLLAQRTLVSPGDRVARTRPAAGLLASLEMWGTVCV